MRYWLTIATGLAFAVALFMMGRPKGRETAKIAFVLSVFGFGAVMRVPSTDTDEVARAAGFTSLSDRKSASAAGITDAKTWIERRPEIEAKERAARNEKVDREVKAIADKARAAGFDNPADYIAAQTAGVSDGVAWARRKAEDTFFKVPDDQAAFVSAAVSARTAYRNAPNELAQGGTRAKRRADLCSVLKARAVSNWVGTIVDLSSNGDGKGVLAVRIGDGVTVKTWNNAVSDIGDKTLIEPNTDLFAKLATMTAGQKVKFSGQFIGSDVDCVREGSMTLAGSMTEPEFVFRFRLVLGM